MAMIFWISFWVEFVIGVIRALNKNKQKLVESQYYLHEQQMKIFNETGYFPVMDLTLDNLSGKGL